MVQRLFLLIVQQDQVKFLLNGEAGELFEVSNVTELLNKLEIIHNKEYNKAKIEETLERYTKENFINNFRKVIE